MEMQWVIYTPSVPDRSAMASAKSEWLGGVILLRGVPDYKYLHPWGRGTPTARIERRGWDLAGCGHPASKVRTF
jgi:hypothetical protein